jgi:hypothetical protein
MARKFSTTPVTCPGLCGPTGQPACGGETVEATGLADFHATQVKVAPCSKLSAQGWRGPQLVLRKSDADQLFPAQTVLQHRDGLVVFA